MKRNIYILSALLAGAVGLTGCSDFLDKQSAAYDSDGFYRTDAGLDEGVTGAYALVPFNLNWDVPPTMVQDVYSPYALQDQENTTIGAGGGLTPDQSYVNSYWAGHYNIVARANSVIDGAKTDRSDMSDMYKARLAEVKFIRAYAYYNLMTTFGDVPFFTSSVTPDQYGAGRTDKKEITDYIVAELNEIAESGDLA